MALVIQCDRCARQVTENGCGNWRELLLAQTRTDGDCENIGDLCPKCVTDLRRFVKNYAKTARVVRMVDGEKTP